VRSGRRLLARLQEPGALSVTPVPIVELDGLRPFGWDFVVAGPADSSLAGPDRLRAFVRAKHAEERMDRAAIEAVLGAARALPAPEVLVVRVHGTTLGRDRELLVFLSDAAAVNGVDPSRLLVEIVGPPAVWHERGFRNNLEGLRAIGARVAVPVGAGSSGWAVVECRPHYLRLDPYLSHGIRTDELRRAVVGSVGHLAEALGARVIAEAEGEDPRHLGELRRAGVHLVQGRLE
jgi:EAL domain-containing protein (putative c-di-GMP-specific phosphodiesterase class I)